MKLTIQGLQEAQRANVRHISAMKPTGAFGRMIQYATMAAHRYAVSITHVDTGSLKAAHRMQLAGIRGEIYIDPQAVNPRSRERPAEYGVEEHERGGNHAFYERTEREGSDRIVREAASMFTRELR